MTAEGKRLKEIKHEKYETCVEITRLKKKLKQLQIEEDMINGYHRIERAKKKYVRTMGKRKRK